MPIPPDFVNRAGGAGDPASLLFPVTPNDGADLPARTRGIYVGGTGDLRVTDQYDNTVTFVGVPSGSILTVRAVRILATGTTATGIVGLA